MECIFQNPSEQCENEINVIMLTKIAALFSGYIHGLRGATQSLADGVFRVGRCPPLNCRLMQQSAKKVQTGFDIANRYRYYAPRSNNSSVVQSVERRTVNPYVTGSSPVRGARFEKPAQGYLSGLFAFGDFPLRLAVTIPPFCQ